MAMVLCFFIGGANAQLIGDFEQCLFDGQPLSDGIWSDWGCGGGAGCGIMCSSAQAHSGEWSGLIPGDGTTDAVLDLGNKIFGEWGLEFWMYIPSNKVGYFNLQGTVPIGAGEWIVGNFFFNQNNANPGVGFIDDTALGEVYFNFPHDEWFKIVMNVDISTGIGTATWQLFVKGIEIIPQGTPFTDGAGTYPTSLGGMDLFSISTDNEYYVDDFYYTDQFIDPLPIPFVDDMEYEVSDPFAEWWYDCPSECPIITTDQAYSGTKSAVVPGDGATTLTLDLNNQTVGASGLKFQMYVPSDKEAYWNLQGEIPVGAGELIVGNFFFNRDNLNPGVGLIDDTAFGDVNFSFPHDTWFEVIINVDIFDGIGNSTWQLLINGAEVIPEGTPFTNEAGMYPTSFGGLQFYSISTDNQYYLDDVDYIEAFHSSVLGVNDVAAIDFVLYPNPAFETLTIQTSSHIESVAIYSLQGRLVKKFVTATTLDVSQLDTGIYFVQVVTNDGIGVAKFVKN
jgi:hypothetical protein